MARPKNKPRTTPKKNDAPDLKERPSNEKTVDLKQHLNRSETRDQQTGSEDNAQPVPDNFFRIDDQEFRYADIDADVMAAIRTMAVLSEDKNDVMQSQIQMLIHPDDYDRFSKVMLKETKQALKARQAWKADGSNVEDEPPSVEDFTGGVLKALTTAWRELAESDPKDVEP